MLFVALHEAAQHGELLLVDGGLCRFHRRRDGVVVIREILVLPTQQRQGIGRALVAEVRRRYPGAMLVARCPASYPSNGFWEHMGFRVTPGDVNTWHLPG